MLFFVPVAAHADLSPADTLRVDRLHQTAIQAYQRGEVSDIRGEGEVGGVFVPPP